MKNGRNIFPQIYSQENFLPFSNFDTLFSDFNTHFLRFVFPYRSYPLYL